MISNNATNSNLVERQAAPDKDTDLTIGQSVFVALIALNQRRVLWSGRHIDLITPYDHVYLARCSGLQS